MRNVFYTFNRLRPGQITLVWWTAFLLACVPVLRLVVLGVTNVDGGLSPNPVEFITRNTGNCALYLLTITLAITPLRKLTGWNWLARMRRMLGVMAFFYLCLHFTAFFWFDHFFDLGEMWQDILRRPFIAVGMVTLLLMIPLAITSWSRMMRLLGGKRWQLLHRLIYLVAPLAVLHFWWAKAGKNLIFEPFIFACIVGALLLLRLVARFSRK